MAINTKTCSRCGENKGISYFTTRKASFDGLQPKCKECERLYRDKNKERRRVLQKAWDDSHRERKSFLFSRWVKENVENRAAYQKNYGPKYEASRKLVDPEYKMVRLLRRRLLHALKGAAKKGSAINLLGCTVGQARHHLETLFHSNPETGEVMSWDNHGVHGWHIDHIRPLASFNLQDVEQLANACHYTNLQPLWAKENLAKGARSPF